MGKNSDLCESYLRASDQQAAKGIFSYSFQRPQENLSDRSEVKLCFKTKTLELLWIFCLTQGRHSQSRPTSAALLFYTYQLRFFLFQIASLAALKG